jgi:hypothetical protein
MSRPGIEPGRQGGMRAFNKRATAQIVNTYSEPLHMSSLQLDENPLCIPSPLFVQNLEEYKFLKIKILRALL